MKSTMRPLNDKVNIETILSLEIQQCKEIILMFTENVNILIQDDYKNMQKVNIQQRESGQ